MLNNDEIRPNPDHLLRTVNLESKKEEKGKLKIFFGMCAGVGKTYDMLKTAQEAKTKGIDVVIGYVETHKRLETEALVTGLPIVPRKRIEYKGASLEEMDLDAILTRRPPLVLVDELAHTNAPGSRHTKRYQDVQELLDNNIDVYTTLNVQHLESRADTVARITGSVMRETVPDSIFEQADEVEIIDIPPDELLKRLSDGKVYTPERSQQAIQNFFRKGNLTALREMSLRLTAERVEHQLRDYMQAERIRGPWKSGQRLLVGVTPSRDSVRLIRWTRRLAFAMQTSWVAVFVERAAPLNEAQHDQFAKNIALARELGAEIITTADEDIAAALVRVAKEQNATQIIVGKSGEKRFMQKSVVDRLIELSSDVDVYVTSGEEAEDRKPKALFRVPDIQSGFAQYAIATGIIVLVSVLCYPFTSLLGYQTVSLMLLLTVVLLPLRLGVGPVLLAAVLSALSWDFFFIPPRFTFFITTPQDVLMVVTYFAIAAVTGVLTVRVRAREKAVRLREERATALYSLTNDLSSANSQDEVVGAAVSNIKKFFNAEVAIFLSELDGDFVNRPHSASSYTPGDKELGVSAWVHWNEKRAGKFTDTLPFAEAIYLPLSGPRYPLGVIGVKPAQRFSLDQEILLGNFISQISSALDREFLNEMAKQSVALAESERLYTTLFNSISHEMRTPITALLGASESLAQDNVGGRESIRRELAIEIQSAAERLDNIVQNLLAMTRLESGLIQPKLDWADVRDIINSSVAKLQKELSTHKLTIDISAGVSLVKVDFPLMEQVIVNLLRNAALHTPSTSCIKVTVTTEGKEVVISVADNGTGLPPDSLDKAFDKFYRVPGAKTGGIGLGLSIALGFVQAHKGSIHAENNEHGGAKFTVRLPFGPPAQPIVEESNGE
ncbi:MAG TPA: sensor histidine kinase KdpD [Bacteroidota bacterium]|jgi:two-component system sensor histidine kinase KdpD|nr:sensor histidine kinase KdpD [Bacteroidota bacterium]